jgi:hypothetical protein
VYGSDPFAYDFEKALASARVAEPVEPPNLDSFYMHLVPVKDASGKTIGVLGDPDPAKLARRVQLYGSEGAESWLKQETPSAVQAVISRKSKRRSRSRINKRDTSSKFSKEATA